MNTIDKSNEIYSSIQNQLTHDIIRIQFVRLFRQRDKLNKSWSTVLEAENDGDEVAITAAREEFCDTADRYEENINGTRLGSIYNASYSLN